MRESGAKGEICIHSGGSSQALALFCKCMASASMRVRDDGRADIKATEAYSDLERPLRRPKEYSGTISGIVENDRRLLYDRRAIIHTCILIWL
jgi:hypothetical protein